MGESCYAAYHPFNGTNYWIAFQMAYSPLQPLHLAADYSKLPSCLKPSFCKSDECEESAWFGWFMYTLYQIPAIPLQVCNIWSSIPVNATKRNAL